MDQNFNKVLKKVKDNNQDFEWYPTTNEIIKRLYQDLLLQEKFFTILDIGAGNGKIFSELKRLRLIDTEKYCDSDNYIMKNRVLRFNFESYAIEKSKILIEQMEKDIFIIGTDFYQQTLIDKKMDIIFCNPPYKEFTQWMLKILKESSCQYIYMVVPDRWKEKKSLMDMIEFREINYKIIDSYSFEKSEDRKARANVDLVKFELHTNKYRTKNKVDAFDIWFSEHFSINADKTNVSSYFHKKKEELKTEIVSKKDKVKSLVEFYNSELVKLLNIYKSLEQMDYSLLKELGMHLESLKSGLQKKIEGLKDLYWKVLFDELEEITRRLTSKSRQGLFDKLTKNTSIDFTESNIYSVIIWVIKNSNKYFDEQLIDLYERLSDQKNIRLYKSNKKMVEDGWRYNKCKMTHYSLDYRIIYDGYYAIEYSWAQKKNILPERAKQIISDIFTIAYNLGFSIYNNLNSREWVSGEVQEFEFRRDHKIYKFCDIKIFKNGNVHFRFCPEFMKRFNIEASRINKWVKSPSEATEEFDISQKEAEIFFNSNFLFQSTNDINLLPGV